MAATTTNWVMRECGTTPGEIENISHRYQTDKTNVIIIGHRDFSIDGLASMLQSGDSNLLVTCIEPEEAGSTELAGAVADVLLIQNEILQEPLGRCIQSLVAHFPDARVLVFGKDMNDNHLYRLVRLGVHGYLGERMHGDEIKRALARVLDGSNWIERRILERFVVTQHDFDSALQTQFQSKIEDLCHNLTKRETEILCEVVKGLAIKQIAEHVHLSHQGVKMHLAKLFKKFNVSNRNQLILAAFDKITPLEDVSLLLDEGLKKRLRL
jgi:DNA-binding NarL/FixJ family response regulator